MKGKIISRDSTTQVVEFLDGQIERRVWIPANTSATIENARMGIDVGPTLEDIEALGLVIDAEKLLRGLHRRGIWTAADVRAPHGSTKVKAALFEGLGWATAQLVNLYQNRR